MITEILGLAGSGVAGSLFGILSDMMHNRSENKRQEMELRLQQEARLNGQSTAYIQSVISEPAFAKSFFLLCLTYCTCAIICFLFPDVPLQTFNPDDEPREISFLWGLFDYTMQSTKVYTITTGGVGYALLHPLAFQIGTVITGINAGRR